jgi:nucleotide-binding universal stress UspA family protein
MALIELCEPAQPKAAARFGVKNLLYATDFSATSEAALPYATAICRRFGATLHVVHIISDAALIMMTGGVDYVSMGTLYDDANIEATKKLEQLTARFADITHKTHIGHGAVWANLADVIETNAIDLIIVGTHGRTGLGKLLLGSVAEDILRHASCPVLTVGPKVAGHDKLPDYVNHKRDLAPSELDLRQILFATNFAQNAASIAQTAVSLAEEFEAQLTVMHVIEDYAQLGSRPDPIDQRVRRIKDLIPKNAALQYPPASVLEFGAASDRILKVAADREADLIILGARPAAEAGSSHLPWSTAHAVIAQAPCPVLTLRG